MPKAIKDFSVKTTSKASKTKTFKEVKTPREPSKYQQFMSVQLKLWKEQNPDRAPTDAMKEVAVIWRDSPENPNRGKAPRPRKKKAAKPGSSSEPSSSSPPRLSESVPSSDL
ncbi:hypothetical protein IW261DRAFT_1460004 [Armillaria novae-zelandiae]|uniref:HMG box domain-containing protein n=1 Tax=Armillaria novae-zelandiae TaxID=153914 RepID=A0AA39UJ88_9AGAR|nr:hypothetical protein IW261DRAFT_1460004 [Armillaria novae-zelandiae]